MLGKDEKEHAVSLLFDENCSCVIRKGDTIRLFRKRGVQDLLTLLHNEPEFVSGAFIADKIVGKGAAALMVLCRFGEVYADVISTPARQLLDDARIKVSCSQEVPNIINRTNTGICPVEQLCSECKTAEECLPKIETFAAAMAANSKNQEKR